MKENHIILHNIASPIRIHDIFKGPGFFNKSGGTQKYNGLNEFHMDIKIEELDRNDIITLTNRPEISAIAPAMPVKLIEPVNFSSATHDVMNDITWGIKAVGADTSPFSGEGVTVAILDTGIDRSHLAFKGVTIIEKDFTGEGNGDSNGHGTHVAGTIFGRNVNNTRIGIAQGIKKVLVGKVLGNKGGSSDMIAKAINWAVGEGANVISMSLGIDFPGYVRYLENKGIPTEPAVAIALEGYRANVSLFEDLAAYLSSLGRGGFSQPVIIIAAAGNENVAGDYKIYVSPPAISDGIISVAAIANSVQGYSVAPFSNTGANISGPGVGIFSAKAGSEDKLVAFNGTSMATPHVAGVAALWMEKLTKEGMFNALNATARLINSGSVKGFGNGYSVADIGTGLVQAPQNA